MIEWVIIGLRCLLVPFALVTLWLNGRALLAIWKGSQAFSDTARAGNAFIAMAALCGQFYFLIWNTAPALLLSLTLMNVGLWFLLNLSRRGDQAGLRTSLEKMIDRPDLALPLVELAEVDPNLAEMLAQQTREATAAAKKDAL